MGYLTRIFGNMADFAGFVADLFLSRQTLIGLLIIMSLNSCATPSQHFDKVANELGFYAKHVNGKQFQHVIYTIKDIEDGEILHVYIDGDGTPWERNRWISDDPTARNPLILRLMSQDKGPSILLGRPCYYGLSDSLECDNKYWTSHRYSKGIVERMTVALNAWLYKHGFNEVVLIGYSGGGSIAILMADKIKKINKVVTIAANLNLKSWREFHGYSALINSLNPADEVELNTKIKQTHFAGEYDEVVPAFIIKGYAERQKNAEYYEYVNKDHSCCWEDEWLNMLGLIE